MKKHKAQTMAATDNEIRNIKEKELRMSDSIINLSLPFILFVFLRGLLGF